jgi:hypothetical protein
MFTIASYPRTERTSYLVLPLIVGDRVHQFMHVCKRSIDEQAKHCSYSIFYSPPQLHRSTISRERIRCAKVVPLLLPSVVCTSGRQVRTTCEDSTAIDYTSELHRYQRVLLPGYPVQYVTAFVGRAAVPSPEDILVPNQEDSLLPRAARQRRVLGSSLATTTSFSTGTSRSAFGGPANYHGHRPP